MTFRVIVLTARLAVSPASAGENAALDGASFTAREAAAAAQTTGERSSSALAGAFGEKTAPGPVPVGAAFKPAPVAAFTAPRVYAASEAPPAPFESMQDEEKKEDEEAKPPPWDAEGTLKASLVGTAGAAAGLLVAGPIGACAGFLGGLFIGALLWRAGMI